MKISYNQATDSLYVHLTGNASVDSDEVTDGVVLDFDANGALVGVDVQQASQRAGINNEAVKCSYLEKEDIFQVHLSDKPIVREISPDWHTNISYAEDGTIVEIVLLDAKKEGFPTTFKTANGDQPGRVVEGLGVSIGQVSVTNVAVGVGLRMDDESQALLGQSFLSKFDITIGKNQMVLRSR